MGEKKNYKVDTSVEAHGDVLKKEPDGQLTDIDLTLGMYRVVEAYVDILAIPAGKRKEGMKAYVRSTGITYHLIGGTTDVDWTPNVMKETFVNGGNDTLVVADITKYKSIKMTYSMNRGGLEEVGTIILTNTVGTPLSRNFDFDFCGMNMSKQITNNDLEIVWNDVFSNGDDTEFFAYIERIIL